MQYTAKTRVVMLAVIAFASVGINMLVARSQTPTFLPTDPGTSSATDQLAPPVYSEVEEWPFPTEEISATVEALALPEGAEMPAAVEGGEMAAEDGAFLVQRATELPASAALSNSDMTMYVVGGVDHQTYHYMEITMPAFMLDADGGRVRMIMQHEIDPLDQVRVIDLTIGAEHTNDGYGRRGRAGGRYGWTRQEGGGDYAWILGDGTRHNIAHPWEWAWILDYRWLGNNTVLGGNKIRLYSHPHVTTRFIFYPN